MNHIFAFINKILYYVYLSLRPDNIEQMPEPVPDSTELLLPLILRPFQRRPLSLKRPLFELFRHFQQLSHMSFISFIKIFQKKRNQSFTDSPR